MFAFFPVSFFSLSFVRFFPFWFSLRISDCFRSLPIQAHKLCSFALKLYFHHDFLTFSQCCCFYFLDYDVGHGFFLSVCAVSLYSLHLRPHLLALKGKKFIHQKRANSKKAVDAKENKQTKRTNKQSNIQTHFNFQQTNIHVHIYIYILYTTKWNIYFSV